MAVPYTFANATTSIPLSQLDSNFSTGITLGNTTVYLGNTTTSLGNVALANANVTSGTINNVTIGATTANSGSFTTVTASGNVTINGGTAKSVLFLDGSKVVTANSTFLFDGANLLVGTATAGVANGGIQSLPAGNGAGVPFFGLGGNSASASDITFGIYSTAASQYQFYVDYSGVVHARNGSISVLSDRREKTNIKPLEIGLAEILLLKPRRFDFIDGSRTNVSGFIAQEVQEVFPDLIDSYKQEKEDRLGLRTGDVIPALVKAIQELAKRISVLESK